MRDMSFTGAALLLSGVVLFVLMLLVGRGADLSADSALIVTAIFAAVGFVIGVMLIALDRVRDAILRKLEADE